MNAIVSKTALASGFKPQGDMYWDWYNVGTAIREDYYLSSNNRNKTIDMSTVFVEATTSYPISSYDIFAVYIQTNKKTSDITFGCFGQKADNIPNPAPFLSSPVFGSCVTYSNGTYKYTRDYINFSTHPANLTVSNTYQVNAITIKVILRGAVLKAL